MPAYSLYDPRVYQTRLSPHVVYFYDKTWGDFHMPTHTHPQVELMAVVSGRCSVFCGREPEQEYRMNVGDYILLDTDLPHRLSVEEETPCQMKNVEFTFSQADETQVSMGQVFAASDDFKALVRRREPIVLGHDAQGDLLRALDTLLTFYLYSLEKPHAKAVTDHAFSVLLMVIAYLQGQEKQGGGAITLRRALQYIQAHGQEPLRIPCIAQAAGVHPVYLQRLFHQSMGMTIVEYVTSQRVERAAYLLRHTARPAAEIAAEAGFGSRQQFYRSFLAVKGRSPTQYRAEHKGGGV